jgi:DNA-binding NtrC family response regulator
MLGRFPLMAKKKVLIVEDDASMRDIYRELFLDFGKTYELVYTSGVEEAIDVLNTHKIALVILDIIMWPISGEYLYLKLREDSKFKNKKVPVIVVSVLKKENLVRLEKIGDVSIFEKPISKEIFLKTVSEKLARK